MQNNSRAFVNQLVISLVLAIGLGGGAGLGTVWMRHQISTTANHIRAVKAQTAEVERFISEKVAEVASAQRPDSMRLLNEQFRLGLVPISDVPIFNASTDEAVRGLVARASRDLMERPPSISFNLAQH